MKRTSIYIATALVGALAVGALAGCSSQPASSASASAESAAAASASADSAAAVSASAESATAMSAEASAGSTASESAAATQSQDEITAELKDALANVPAFKSVTVTVEEESTFTSESETTAEESSASAESSEAVTSEAASSEAASSEAASSEAASSEAASSESATSSDADVEESAESDTYAETTVYKFDASGDKLKTSVDADALGIKMQFFTDGDDAVFVSDGPAYSGTTEQFGLAHAQGVDALIAETIGNLDSMVDCTATAEKMESNGLTFYMLTLDPEKYIASDEILTSLSEYGTTVQEAFLTIGFEENGSICSIDLATTYEDLKSGKHMMFSDYDSTVVDPMPKADKTYEEMEADSQEKLDALTEELENDAPETEASSEDAVEVK